MRGVDHSQGKSLSLICASLTWLRNHKSNQFETSLKEAGEAYKGEPAWLVDQLLTRRRDELVQRWQDREKRLATIRLKEKVLEERGRKRRRLEAPEVSGSRKDVDAHETEWLLEDLDDRDARPRDALSGLSKESREVLERLGLGESRKKKDDEEVLDEEIKVRERASLFSLRHINTFSDPRRSIIRQEHTRNSLSSSPNCVGPSSLHHCPNPSLRKMRQSKNP